MTTSKTNAENNLSGLRVLIHDRCECSVLTNEQIEVSPGYSYYCPQCDEDLFAFETQTVIV
jgi:hypothetical protein